MARGLASLGVEFSEEAVEPVTGYRVDMLLHGGDGRAAGRCAVEVSIYIFCAQVVVIAQRYRRYSWRCHYHNFQHCHGRYDLKPKYHSFKLLCPRLHSAAWQLHLLISS